MSANNTHPTTNTTTNNPSSTGASNAGGNLGKTIKEGATQIHGLGEALRGNFNQAVDGAFNEKEGVSRNAGIASKGVDEMVDGQYRGHPEDKTKRL